MNSAALFVVFAYGCGRMAHWLQNLLYCLAAALAGANLAGLVSTEHTKCNLYSILR